MIYGNPNAQSESNGNAVFELFNVQGIVGFWHMDEPQWTGATGEVKDETGVNHGTAYGGATTTSDAVYGRAGYFDGSNDYVKVPNNPTIDITDPITIEAWINVISGTGGHIVSKKSDDGTQYVFYIISGFLKLYGTSGNLAYNASVDDDQWHHVVGIIDGANSKMYFDGNPVQSGTVTSSNNPTADLYIGTCYTFDSACFYDGKIDELRIYNRALTPTEVQILSKNYMQKMGSYFNVRKYVTPAPVVIV